MKWRFSMKKNFLISLLPLGSFTLFGADAQPKETDTALFLLQENNFNPNALHTENDKIVPNIFCTFYPSSSAKTLKHYLDLGADIDSRHPIGDDLLMCAVSNNLPEHLQVLLDHPEVNIESVSSDQGLRALMAAA